MNYALTVGDWLLLGVGSLLLILFYDRVLLPKQRCKELERRKNDAFVDILNKLSECSTPEGLQYIRFRIMIFHAMYYEIGNGDVQLRDLENAYVDKEKQLSTELFNKKSTL